jgi:hypothetical protein
MFPSVNLPSHISPTSSQALCLHLERRLGLLPNSASCRHLRLEHHLRPELDLTPPLLRLLGSLHRGGEEDWEEVVAARVGAITPDSCEEVTNWGITSINFSSFLGNCESIVVYFDQIWGWVANGAKQTFYGLAHIPISKHMIRAAPFLFPNAERSGSVLKAMHHTWHVIVHMIAIIEHPSYPLAWPCQEFVCVCNSAICFWLILRC